MVTDATGGYRIGFTATVFGTGFLARAQVIADGYDDYWRSIRASAATTFVESFHMKRITRMTAGDSTVLSIPPDSGDCIGWVAEVCPFVHVAVPKDGNLRIEAIAADQAAAQPRVEVCCVSGDERIANPITVPAVAGVELVVKVGLQRGFTTTQSFVVKTSFESD